MMPHPTSARGSEPQEQGCGTVSIWGARARLPVRRPCPEAGGSRPVPYATGQGRRPHRARDPGWAAPSADRVRSASPSAPPEPREPRDATSRSPTRPGPEVARSRRPGYSGPRRCPGSAPSGPRSPLLAPSPTFPRDKPGDRYPAWPTPQGSGHLGSLTRPRRLLPGLAQLTPCTRTHAAQPTCSLF
ncbi:hypothetical protein PAL_GLEAN10001182 [Pteropus alecto]|uniref:Uncharacterized protein n=1 Tax=Pteropus alecto TaxID=9402 RepID=L5K7B9_PTEAL|nr:hypothetical protein PAL_GLEAN10001182 [Pteropus alecto]